MSTISNAILGSTEQNLQQNALLGVNRATGKAVLPVHRESAHPETAMKVRAAHCCRQKVEQHMLSRKLVLLCLLT